MTFKNTPKEITKLKRQLQDLLSDEIIESNLEKVHLLKEEIKLLWAQEEKY